MRKTLRSPASEASLIIDRATQFSGLSKRALARRAGISPETLTRVGTRGTADFATVLNVVKAAGLVLSASPRRAESGPHDAPVGGGHDRLDTRSLVLHALIAGKVLASPSLIESRVLPTIQRFKAVHANTGTVRLLEAWERAARAGVNELMGICTDPSETGRQLRQASPMTGLLLSSERRRVYEAFAA